MAEFFLVEGWSELVCFLKNENILDRLKIFKFFIIFHVYFSMKHMERMISFWMNIMPVKFEPAIFCVC